VDADGAFLGGAITLGLQSTSEALFRAVARLIRVELTATPSVIGRNAVESIQSGLVYGSAGQIDRLTEMLKEELGPGCKVIATGGLAETVSRYCGSIDAIDPSLTLYGLRVIYDRVRGKGR